jgi:hypothetical protein
MSYVKKFQTCSGNIEKLRQFLESNSIEGKIEEHFSHSRGSGNSGTIDGPTGWATLTIKAPAPKLRKELD